MPNDIGKSGVAPTESETTCTVGNLSHGSRETPATSASPMVAVISPLYANVFLHYVLDLWINDWRKRHAHGEVTIVRYADDFVIGFREESDARACFVALQERFAKFSLELHSEKTRLIEFGRYAEERRRNAVRARRRHSTFWVSRISAERPDEAISRSSAERRGRNSKPRWPNSRRDSHGTATLILQRSASGCKVCTEAGASITRYRATTHVCNSSGRRSRSCGSARCAVAANGAAT